MNKRIRILASLLAAGILTGLPVHAATVSLAPSETTLLQNETFTVDLLISAADAPGPRPALISGEIVIDFAATLLSYGGFVPASGVSYFKNPTSSTSNGIQSVTFGFQNATDVGSIGVFTFTAIGTPPSLATIGLRDFDDFFGTFVNKQVSDQPFVPTFVGTEVNISAVPLPAGVWFLATGVAFLGTRIRWRAPLR